MIDLKLNSARHDPLPRGRQTEILFTVKVLDDGYWPGRGILYSLLIHAVFVFGVTFVSMSGFLADRFPPSNGGIATIDPRQLHEVIYLPVVGGGPSGMDTPEESPEAEHEDSTTASASNVDGLSYPGLQPLLSDFPVPTIPIQTLVRPELQDLLPAESPVTLPNVVQMASASGREPPRSSTPTDLEPPETERDASNPSPPDSLAEAAPGLLEPPASGELPQLMLPEELGTSSPLDTRELMSRSMAPEEAAAVEVTAPDPEPEIDLSAVELDELPLSNGKLDQHTLLALSPFPASLDRAVEVPYAELRGRFAISPEANLPAFETEPGGELANDALDVGLGNASPTAANSAFGDGTGHDASGTVDRGGAASTDGVGRGSAADDSRWVTIGGGSSETGIARNPAPALQGPAPVQTAYGLTIISTENSGGGLPDLGVFSSEKVHTVYLDMRRSLNDLSPSWILEFALQQPTEARSGGSRVWDPREPELVLPFPTEREYPALAPELLHKYLRRLVIVYGVVSVEGKMEEMSVKQSPDELFNEPILTALSRWVFRPAQLGGQLVPAKLLLGIPVSLAN